MTRPALCETVTGDTLAELRAARDAATMGDMVELRLDGVRDLDVALALEGRTRPAIVTCRPTWEGGRFAGSEDERRRVLERACECGAEWVDVEWRAGFGDLVGRRGRTRVVLSHHDFAGVPADLGDRHRAMRAVGADVVKIAVTARRLSDVLPLIDLHRDGPVVALAMGAAGLCTRLLPGRFGSCWSYAGREVAPGQIPAEEMLRRYRFRDVGPRTALFGVVGTPIAHSLSPVMQNAAFEAAGVDAVYLPLEASDFDDFERVARALDVRGASVTIPFKRDALTAAARADDRARAVGAANTLRRTVPGWEATNTDVDGFLAPLIRHAAAEDWAIEDSRVSVLGAGGAARAVVYGLRTAGAAVRVHARKPAQAEALAADLGVSAAPWPPEPGSWDLLVNCTPLGGVGHESVSPLPGGPFRGRLVYDLVYTPAETRLLEEARQAGCATLGGLPMLVAQAERQFAWWLGRPAPAGVMAAAVEARGTRAAG